MKAIGVIGAGQMGAGIAQVSAAAGYRVLLSDVSAERAEAGKAGIAKQLARNRQLPPGLDYQPLPGDLIVQLPPLQPGYRYTIVDDKVLLVQAASNLILDALEVAALEILK